MLYPSMSELLKKVDNRYLLVNLTARRAREISDENERNEVKTDIKPVRSAINEIANGILTATCRVDSFEE